MLTKKGKHLLGWITALIVIILILGGVFFIYSNKPHSTLTNPLTNNYGVKNKNGGKSLNDGLIETENFTVAQGPTVKDTSLTNAPSYFYLFTHTEDPFNHELSENRYWQVGDMIESIDKQYPSADISWMIEFQGSDAKTVTDRNPETGLVDYLLSLKDKGLVEFGYHAFHDPTYLKRPQKNLSDDPSYDEAYDALWSWITCVKNLDGGGCVEQRGGGLEAILNTFGQVNIVTGLGIGQGTQFERSAGSQAVKYLLPNRFLGFGFPDHGGTLGDNTYKETRDELLTLLTPTHETSSSTLWIDNAIRINDDAPLEDLHANKLREGSTLLQEGISPIDGTRPHVLNAEIADKFLYTVNKTSPTIWGYSHPESPELPSQYTKSTKEIEQGYNFTEESLQYLAELVSGDTTKFFVNSQDVVDLFTSDDYWNVDKDELEQMALWLLNEWATKPPNWVYDGEDFYSLSDAFALLMNGMNDLYPDNVVSIVYGPWSNTQVSTGATTVSTDDLYTLLNTDLIENNQIQETYRVGSQKLTATQVLYALSTLYAMKYEGVTTQTITIPQTQTAPETYTLLEDLGCTDCLDSSWSLKPARFQD